MPVMVGEMGVVFRIVQHTHEAFFDEEMVVCVLDQIGDCLGRGEILGTEMDMLFQAVDETEQLLMLRIKFGDVDDGAFVHARPGPTHCSFP